MRRRLQLRCRRLLLVGVSYFPEDSQYLPARRDLCGVMKGCSGLPIVSRKWVNIRSLTESDVSSDGSSFHRPSDPRLTVRARGWPL